MRFSNLFATTAVVLGCVAIRVSAYFVIKSPTSTTGWVNGAANAVTWVKGLDDGIDSFDVELARMSSDGLTLVAHNVPTFKTSSLNIFLQDIPAGDDYLVMFVNASSGVMYTISSTFSILASGMSLPSNLTSATVDKSAATVTVSGTPNPTALFATTFPPSSGSLQRWRTVPAWTIAVVTIGSMAGAALAIC